MVTLDAVVAAFAAPAPAPGAPVPGAPVPPADALPSAEAPAIDLAGGNPAVERLDLPTSDAQPAAVLCALFDDGGQAHVLLTRRSSRLRSHTGEVAFPGGRLEPGESAEEAALREAREEIGLDPATVTIIGALTPLATFTSQSAITPLVGLLPGPPVLHPNPDEVARVFAVPLGELMARGAYHAELWRGRDRPDHLVHFFDLPGETVWGATARLLFELLERVVESPAA